MRLSGQTMEAVENPFSNLEEEMTETNDTAQEELEEVWTGGDEMCTPYCIGSGLHTAMHQDVHIPSPPVHIFSNSSCQYTSAVTTQPLGSILEAKPLRQV